MLKKVSELLENHDISGLIERNEKQVKNSWCRIEENSVYVSGRRKMKEQNGTIS